LIPKSLTMNGSPGAPPVRFVLSLEAAGRSDGGHAQRQRPTARRGAATRARRHAVFHSFPRSPKISDSFHTFQLMETAPLPSSG
jgi:hypothetical protein